MLQLMQQDRDVRLREVCIASADLIQLLDVEEGELGAYDGGDSMAFRAGAWLVLAALEDAGVSADSRAEPRLDEILGVDEAVVRRRLMTVMKRVPEANRYPPIHPFSR